MDFTKSELLQISKIAGLAFFFLVLCNLFYANIWIVKFILISGVIKVWAIGMLHLRTPENKKEV